MPVKRGRGRPKGSLNKKTIARVAEEEADVPVPFTLDVDFESNEILGESEPITEPEEPEELASPPPPPPKLKRTVSRKTPPAPPVSAEESEDEPPPPKRKRAVRMRAQPRREPVPEATVPPPVVRQQPPPTYLEVLTRGLRAAQATQKAQKVARYDAFFAR